jgi:hypothetical protein
VQSCLSLTSLRGKGLRYCNCLRAQSRKGLRRPNLRPGMRPPTSDGQKKAPGAIRGFGPYKWVHADEERRWAAALCGIGQGLATACRGCGNVEKRIRTLHVANSRLSSFNAKLQVAHVSDLYFAANGAS